MSWTTKLSDVAVDVLDRYGVEELHVAYFTPVNYPGVGPVVSLGLPECELAVCFLDGNGEPLTIVNRPKVNRDVKGWIRIACKTAIEYGAVVSFNCDTLEQLEHAVRLAQRRLPGYERAALERMRDPQTRAKAGLS